MSDEGEVEMSRHDEARQTRTKKQGLGSVWRPTQLQTAGSECLGKPEV